MSETTYTIHPIGTIKAEQGRFTIHINPVHREALIELEGFSHIQVFWWGHLLDDAASRQVTIAEKAYKKGPERIGIFATRSPVRPNPILVTTVPVIDMDQNQGTITIPFIDAENESPLVDIKGYYPFERVKSVAVPQWCAHWPQWYEESGSFDWAAEFETAS